MKCNETTQCEIVDRQSRARRCFIAITSELDKLPGDKFHEEFSRILEKHLSDVYLTQDDRCRAAVFWSLGTKAPIREMIADKSRNWGKHLVDIFEDRTIPANGRRRAFVRHQLNHVLGELNGQYDSVPYLAHLSKHKATTRVFDFAATDKGIAFRGFRTAHNYSTREAFQVELSPQPLSLRSSLDDLYNCIVTKQDKLPALATCDQEHDSIDELRRALKAEVESVCKRWKDCGSQLVDLAGNDSGRNKVPDPESASMHFALLTIMAVNNGCACMSYILARRFADATPSSMVVYWPSREIVRQQYDVLYQELGLPFLLQDVLADSALQLVYNKRLASATYGIMHPLKGRLGELERPAERIRAQTGERASRISSLVKEMHEVSGVDLDVLFDRVRYTFRFAGLAHVIHLAFRDGWPAIANARDQNGRPRYLKDEELPLHNTIASIAAMRLGMRTSDGILLESQTHAFIETFVDDKWRPDDAIYEAILFEVLRNCVRHGGFADSDRRRVGVSVFSDVIEGRPAICFRNTVRDATQLKHNLGIVPRGTWEQLDRETPSGLTFVKKAIDYVRLGDLRVRCSLVNGKTYFDVGLVLKGLRIGD